MKKKKILGICSLVLAIFILFLGIKSFAGIPTTISNLQDSVVVQDGSCKPENEGKIVTILLNMNNMENAYDDDLDIHFKTPLVKRHVEKLVRVPHTSDSNWEWEWRGVFSPSDGKIYNKTFAGNTRGDILKLSDEIEVMLPAGDILDIDDLTKESQENIAQKFGIREGISRTYFSNASHAAFSEKLEATNIRNPLFKDEGKIRIWYEKAYASDAVYAITGIQKGDTLEKADDLDMVAVNEGITNLDELKSSVIKDTVLSTSAFILIAIVLIFLSLKWMGVIKKKLFKINKKSKS